MHGQRPGDPGDCSALVFVQWADVPGTTNATVFYLEIDPKACQDAQTKLNRAKTKRDHAAKRVGKVC